MRALGAGDQHRVVLADERLSGFGVVDPVARATLVEPGHEPHNGSQGGVVPILPEDRVSHLEPPLAGGAHATLRVPRRTISGSGFLFVAGIQLPTSSATRRTFPSQAQCSISF